LQLILFPIYFVVLLVILKVAVYRPINYPEMANEETLDFHNFTAAFSSAPYQILIAPNISGATE